MIVSSGELEPSVVRSSVGIASTVAHTCSWQSSDPQQPSQAQRNRCSDGHDHDRDVVTSPHLTHRQSPPASIADWATLADV